MEAHGGTLPGPEETSEAAHHSAAAVVGAGRAAGDPAVTARLVGLVEELGLDTVAELWAGRPARSLPGALWRLYVLREWVRRSPGQASLEYAAGVRFAAVDRVIAGAAEPPGPEELRALTDQILTGVYQNDLAVALERAAAFARIVATGRADLAGDGDATTDGGRADRLTESGHALLSMAADLTACARLWRQGTLT